MTGSGSFSNENIQMHLNAKRLTVYIPETTYGLKKIAVTNNVTEPQTQHRNMSKNIRSSSVVPVATQNMEEWPVIQGNILRTSRKQQRKISEEMDNSNCGRLKSMRTAEIREEKLKEV